MTARIPLMRGDRARDEPLPRTSAHGSCDRAADWSQRNPPGIKIKLVASCGVTVTQRRSTKRKLERD